MAYHVEITDSALADAEDYVHFIRDARKQPQAAERWFRGLLSAIFSLERSPSRCSLIPEKDDFTVEVRHFIYHSHRIVFHTDEAERAVYVLRVYHGARRELRPEDIE